MYLLCPICTAERLSNQQDELFRGTLAVLVPAPFLFELKVRDYNAGKFGLS